MFSVVLIDVIDAIMTFVSLIEFQDIMWLFYFINMIDDAVARTLCTQNEI